MMRKVILPMKAVKKAQVRVLMRNLRPRREVALQTGKGQRSRTKSKELSHERKTTCQKSEETKWE